MSKRTVADVSDREFDSEFDPTVAAVKMPTNIAGSVSPLTGYLEIRTDKIIEFQRKKESDFKPWPEERFKVLVDSIRAQGIIEAVIVRPQKDNIGHYEMLAGEHRWKAAKELGLKTIPARVLSDCDDEKAENVFTITNVLRRENSIKDKVNGWWHYVNTTKYRSKGEIERMIEEGELSAEVHESAKQGMRMVYTYAKLHELTDELLDLVDQKQISIAVGEQLAYLSHQQQSDLLLYKRSLNNPSKAKELRSLANGKTEGKEWSDENIKSILFPDRDHKVFTIREVSGKIKSLIQDKVDQAAYGNMEQVISDALDSYLDQHPEYKKK